MGITNLCYPDKSITITCSEDFTKLLGQIRAARAEFYRRWGHKPNLILTSAIAASGYEVQLARSPLSYLHFRPGDLWHRAPMFDDMPIVEVHLATGENEMALVRWDDLPAVTRVFVLASLLNSWRSLSPLEMGRAVGAASLHDVGNYLAQLWQGDRAAAEARR